MPKTSEIIMSQRNSPITGTTHLYHDKLAQVLDEMAEDIKVLKDMTVRLDLKGTIPSHYGNVSPFKEREWEKE